MHPAFTQILLHISDRVLAEMEDARSECRRRIRIPQDLENMIRIPASHLGDMNADLISHPER